MKGTTMSRPVYKRALITLAAVALIVGGVTYVAHAATRNVSCPGTVTDTTTTYTVNVQCSFPKPAPVTVTATVTQTAAPSPTPTPTPTVTPTPSQTPTPTPTATPTVPPPPPTGWPDGSNTGVPAGTVLSSWTGGCTISSPVTIDAKTVNCPSGLDIEAAGVVITRSKVIGPISVDTDTNSNWSLTISDSTVAAGSVAGISAISNGNIIATRLNVTGGHNSFQAEEHSHHFIVQDSYLHGQYLQGADHLAGIGEFGSVVSCDGPPANGVPSCLAVIHSSVLCEPLPNSQDGGCTADLAILNQFGPLHGALIRDNLFGANIGNAYCVYGGWNASHPADHIVFTNNVWQRGSNRKCATYGPVTSFDSSQPGNIWSGNVWDDGTPVPPEN